MWALWLLGCFMHPPIVTHEVALSDLASLEPAALAPLAEPEHALVVARTRLEGARVAVRDAEARVDDAERDQDRARLEVDTALARRDIAHATGDRAQRGFAEGRIAMARRALDGAEARLRWRQALADEARAEERLADARVDLRHAQLEQARVELLHDTGHAPRRYARSAFTEQVKRAQAAYDAAARKADEASDTAGEAYALWGRSGGV